VHMQKHVISGLIFLRHLF